MPCGTSPLITAGNLLEYTVPAGTYGFRVINSADAALLFPALTPQQTNQIYTAWTYNSPWVATYLVFDSSAATNNSVYQLLSGMAPGGYGSAAAAYEAAISNGFAGLFVTGPSGRDGTNYISSFTFNSPSTLIFTVPDGGLYDNAGGVSVLVAPAILQPTLTIVPGPGPSTVTLGWPTNASGFNLGQSTNLQPAVWIDTTNVPTIANTNFSVTLPQDVPSRFFRLHKP